MTTIVYCLHTKTIAADSRNTDGAGAKWLVNKIEFLPDGSVFLGSGHLYTINQCKHWAKHGWKEEKRPDFTFFLEDTDDRDFACLHISKDGSEVVLIDGEMCPQPVINNFMAIGSGAAYALGALEAGASAEEAVKIACNHDGASCLPVRTHTFKE